MATQHLSGALGGTSGRRLFAVVMAAAFCASAFAAEFAVGAVTSVRISPYKSYDTRVMPLPFVTYDSDRLFIKGTGAGGYLLKNDKHELSVGGSFFGLEFKPRHTDERPLKHLRKRRSTIMGDVSYSYISKIGLIRMQANHDVLGQSEGALGNLSLHVPWMTDCFVIMPGVGVEWASAKHNKYYYGVSRKETARGGPKAYTPGQSFTPYLTLEAKFTIKGGWAAVAKGRIDYLPARVRNSPMVGKTFAGSIMAGVQYTF